MSVFIIVKWERAENRLEIPADALVYIGKEANNIEDQSLDVIKPQVFINEED